MPPTAHDPHPNKTRFVGLRVSFDYHLGERMARLVGVVEAQQFTGYTERGRIPDYQLCCRGQTGKLLKVSLVESKASFD